MNKDLRVLDAEIATKLFSLNVVADDWPCGYEPECGTYEADKFLPFTENCWYTEHDYVYLLPDSKWPPYHYSNTHPDELFAAVKPVPFYSSEITDAMLVINWLRKQKCEIVIYIPDNEREYACMVMQGTETHNYPASDIFLYLEWRDGAWLQYGTRKPVRVQAPTLEESICKAALEWVKEK